jgi:hypothetical protein
MVHTMFWLKIQKKKKSYTPLWGSRMFIHHPYLDISHALIGWFEKLYIDVNPTNTIMSQQRLNINVSVIVVSTILVVDLFNLQFSHSMINSLLKPHMIPCVVWCPHTTYSQLHLNLGFPDFTQSSRAELDHISCTKSRDFTTLSLIHTSYYTRIVVFLILRVSGFSSIPSPPPLCYGLLVDLS